MAAETAGKHRPNALVLYRREAEFVAAYTGTTDSAEELLLDCLGQPGRTIRWLPQRLIYPDVTPAQLEQLKKVYGEKAIETYLGNALEFFWRPADHTHIKVDRANSNATRTGPPWIVGSRVVFELIDGKLTPVETSWPIYLTDQPPVTFEARLFGVDHNDVVAALRMIGWLLPESKPQPDPRPNPTVEPASELKPESEPKLEPKPEPKPEPEPEQEQAAESEAERVESLSIPAETQQRRYDPPQPPRHGQQIDRVLRDLPTHFPPAGRVPDKFAVSSVRAMLSPGWKAENKEHDLKDPNWDTVKAAMIQLGWRNN